MRLCLLRNSPDNKQYTANLEYCLKKTIRYIVGEVV